MFFLGFLWSGSCWCQSEIVVFWSYKLRNSFVLGFCDLGHPVLNLNSTSFVCLSFKVIEFDNLGESQFSKWWLYWCFCIVIWYYDVGILLELLHLSMMLDLTMWQPWILMFSSFLGWWCCSLSSPFYFFLYLLLGFDDPCT